MWNRRAPHRSPNLANSPGVRPDIHPARERTGAANAERKQARNVEAKSVSHTRAWPKWAPAASVLSRELGFGRTKVRRARLEFRAAVAACQFWNASLSRARSVLRETRWR